ncbi:hypothetical protein DASC09_026390 [Saccharomycopsis crataegensis]|uniref:Uncharacterized protein n=1 Tax=Saccharomycopsis crataegensis TaxID=43959 RepID=A0AAV5QL13_9ASCO|nr:hypothetical protein DASC09_026390 [Saccharomycopsis crataegensis]
MKLSNSVLISIAAATSASALVIGKNEDGSHIAEELTHESSRNVVVVSPSTKNKNPKAAIGGIVTPINPNNKAVSDDDDAPVFFTNTQDRQTIPHRYMVVFKKNVSPEQISFHQELIQAEQVSAAGKLFAQDPTNQFFATTAGGANDVVGGILHSFDIENVMSGYAGYFLDSTIEMLKKSPLVEFVEQDSIVSIKDFDTQHGAPWGLARISHRDSLNLGSFNKYVYDNEGGKDTLTYVIDTGVLDTHEDFEGRAKLIADIPNDGALDGNGHGTHCAGTMGSKTFGVAKQVHIRGVKVLGANGSGSMSDVVKGVEVATKDYLEQMKKNPKLKGASANMSLGGGKSPSLDMAVNAASRAGLVFSVAAGNENQDACNSSPASAELAITVGASTISDTRAYFSNWGKCVDVFAPGLNVLSTYIGSNKASATLSGTSMASPHVAGLLAYFISLTPESSSEFGSATKITPAQLKKNLIAYSTPNKLSDIGNGSPNVLAYNGAGGDLSEFWASAPLESQSVDSSMVLSEAKEITNALIHELEATVESLIEGLL